MAQDNIKDKFISKLIFSSESGLKENPACKQIWRKKPTLKQAEKTFLGGVILSWSSEMFTVLGKKWTEIQTAIHTEQ